VASDAEAAIRTGFPDADITIHQDPASLGAESEDIADPDPPSAAWSAT
jgi:hypothetical protein